MLTRNIIKSLVLIFWIFSTHLFGLLLFKKGFLLTRNEMKNHSNQNLKFEASSFDYSHNQEEHHWQTFSRLILVIIDGLRFDFIADMNNKSKSFYRDKMRHMQSLMTNNMETTRLFKFIADPPTTTMQRLKGLTTGSFPTFVDAGSNYESSEIEEDNILYQFHLANKTMVFLGDDTWIRLYPGFFKRKFPFPSFDVKDLDTVDEGIIDHMIPEMRKEDWDVIIAHFLGVDHCGHRYGPNHPEMERKLTQIDLFLSNLGQHLDNNTILYVLGDHGMTQNGDHGGDSDDEITSALLVHSRKKLFPIDNKKKPLEVAKVAQVDIVPTLSLQLNVSIPFSNIGSIIEVFFETSQDKVQENPHHEDENEAQHFHNIEKCMNVLIALHQNALQVFRYLKEYSRSSSDIPMRRVQILEEAFYGAEQKFYIILSSYRGRIEETTNSGNTTQVLLQLFSDVLENQQNFRVFLGDVFHAYKAIWAKFNLLKMAFGISVMAIACLMTCNFIIQLKHSTEDELNCGLFAFNMKRTFGASSSLVSWLILLLWVPHDHNSVMPTIFQSWSIICLVSEHVTIKAAQLYELSFSFIDILAILSFIFYIVSQFSNSYTVWENYVLLSLLQTMILSNALKFLQSGQRLGQSFPQIKRQDGKLPKQGAPSQGYLVKVVVSLVMLVSLRLSMAWWSCREEQSYCEATTLLRRLDSIAYNGSSSTIQLRLATASASVIAVLLNAYFWCKRKGDLVGTSVLSIAIQLLTPISGFCVLLHWILQCLGKSKVVDLFDLPWVQQILLPRAVYLFSFATVALLLWNPLGLHTVLRGKSLDHGKNVYFENNVEETKHAVYKELQERTRGSAEVNTPQRESYYPPVLFDVIDVFTSAYIAVLSPVVLLCMLLLGDGLAASVILMVLSALCLLSLPEVDPRRGQVPSVFKIVLWTLLTSYWFFGTGHQATIPSIRFDAAFIGIQGDVGIYSPAVLILLNQFSSAAFFAVSLPLLCVWNASALGGGNKLPKNAHNVQVLHLKDDHWKSVRSMMESMLAYLAASMLKVIATACVAALHRRHLMVWKIFGPRFLFEAVSFVFSIPFLLLGYFFFIRIHQTLKTWILNIEPRCK